MTGRGYANHEVPLTRVAHRRCLRTMGEDGQAMSTVTTRPTTGPSRPGEAHAGRPLATGAALAGAAGALTGLVLCMSVALTGWFLADAGAHGDTTDALRVGADLWLAGHGSQVVLAAVPIGITPLALTMMVVLIAFRAGRWAARHAAPVDDRGLAGAVATFTCAYVVVAVVTCVLASRAGASPALVGALVGAVLVAALGGGCGLATGTGRLAAGLAGAPDWLRDVGTGALTGALYLVAAGAALVGVSLLLSFNEAATVLSELHLSTGDALSFTVVMALFAPNAALFGVSYLVGPGFAFGTGTTISPTAVSLGVVPAFPVLAALPHEGPTPPWLVALLVVPALAAGLGTASTMRRRNPLGHDVAAMRGAGAGFLGGVLVTLLVGLSGGSLGTGRMTDIGAPLAEVLVFATGLMTVGGLAGAVGQNWWGRRTWDPESPGPVRATDTTRGRAAPPPSPATSPVAPDDGDEPTVEVLR